MDSNHRLRVVVVNHNGGDLLRRCIDDVLAMEWPGELEVVVVDNASTDSSIASLAALDSDTRLSIIPLTTNTGFGANNEALTDLDNVDWIALVNPDAFVPADFATGLIDAFDDPSVGAAAPKIIFDDQHVSIRLTASDPAASGANSQVRLTKVEIGGVDVTSRCHVVGDTAARVATSGGAEWHIGASSTLLIPSVPSTPAGDTSPTATVFFRSVEPTAIILRPTSATIPGPPPIIATATSVESATDVALDGTPEQYIQNAGSWVDANGIGGNRGFFHLDDGTFDEPTDVFAWCGAAVMLRADYLADVGLFDPAYFLYYEDTDLSWRGQSRGWTYRYVPNVVVRHRHSASTGQGSELTDVYQQRNRLRMLARNASTPVLLRGVAQSVGSAVKIGIRRAGAVREPNSLGDSTLFVRRAKGIALAATDLPALRKARRELATKRKVPRSEVEQQLRD